MRQVAQRLNKQTNKHSDAREVAEPAAVEAADHFRIASFGTVCASSLYFDQAPGLRCTCYDEGGPPGQCQFHPFGKRLHLSHNSHDEEQPYDSDGACYDGRYI